MKLLIKDMDVQLQPDSDDQVVMKPQHVQNKGKVDPRTGRIVRHPPRPQAQLNRRERV